MGKILVLDTSREFILIGLIQDDSFYFKKFECDRNFSVYLLNQIDLLLKECNVNKSELTAICCGRGPGAFTGIRLSLSVAKTMCYALNIEIFSFSSIIFYSLFVPDKKVISIDDARSYKYYYGLIDKDNNLIVEGIDDDPKVVDYCDLRDDFNVISTREFINITTKVIDNFEYFDLKIFNSILSKENYFSFKPVYIKKIVSGK